MPWAATDPLRLGPVPSAPAVLVEDVVLEDKVLKPGPQQGLDLVFEEPATDLLLRHQRRRHLLVQGLEVVLRQPPHRLPEIAQHVQHPLRRQLDLALVVVQPLVLLPRVWMRAARHHALAGVEPQHHLFVVGLLIGPLPEGGGIRFHPGRPGHVPLPQGPGAIQPQDYRLDVSQFRNQ